MDVELAFEAVRQAFATHASHVHEWVVDRALEDGALGRADLDAVAALHARIESARALASGPARLDSVFVLTVNQVEKDLAVIDWALSLVPS